MGTYFKSMEAADAIQYFPAMAVRFPLRDNLSERVCQVAIPFVSHGHLEVQSSSLQLLVPFAYLLVQVLELRCHEIGLFEQALLAKSKRENFPGVKDVVSDIAEKTGSPFIRGESEGSLFLQQC